MSDTTATGARSSTVNACWQDKRLRWAAFALFAVKLYLVAGQPIFAITPADLDEKLSVLLADSILHGEWLGAYDEKTLVKGAAFSVFMAVTVMVGIPLPIAQHLLYALAAWLMVRALRRWLPNDAWALAIFALVLWNPVTFELGTMGRVLRHNLVTPLAMLVFAGLFSLRTRMTARVPVRVAWAAMLGLSAGTLWLTREETFWIVPSIVVLCAAAFIAARRENVSWLGVAWPLGVVAVTTVAPVMTVAALNAHYYGWFGTVEMRAPEYVGAIGALARVLPPDGPIPFVPINRSVRHMAYEVSPTFRELQPHLEEGAIGRHTSTITSAVTGIPVENMEFADGWGYLAIRQAVHAAGHARNARTALEFYARMAQELNDACDSGRLPAGPRRDTLRPTWQPTYTKRAVQEAIPFVSAFATGAWNNFRAPPSIGDIDGVRLFRDITQWHFSKVEGHPELTMRTMLKWGATRFIVLGHVGKYVMLLGAVVMAAGLIAWTAVVALGIWKRRLPDYLWWAATAAWGGAAAVIAVAHFMHVTSFPISNPGYFSGAYPLAYLAAGISLAALVPLLRSQPVD